MLWKVKVPSKLKVFLWRLVQQSLPYADVLHHRNMATHRTCKMGGAHDSWRHSLLECNMARCVWALASEDIVELIANIQEPHARGWLDAVFHALPQDQLTRVVVTLWAIWHARRKAIHEDIYQSPLSTHMFVERFVSVLDQVEQPKTGTTPEVTPQPRRWIPPPVGLVKVNVDAATSKAGAMSAIAAVARGEAGEYLGASSIVLHGVTDPEMLEAMTCREGMALAADLYLQRFKLATDCINVVKSLEGEGMGPYAQNVREIKARTGDFSEVQFAHEGRTSNNDAHNLARSSLSLDIGRHVWFLDPPVGVCKQIMEQVSDALFSSPGYLRGLGDF